MKDTEQEKLDRLSRAVDAYQAGKIDDLEFDMQIAISQGNPQADVYPYIRKVRDELMEDVSTLANTWGHEQLDHLIQFIIDRRVRIAAQSTYRKLKELMEERYGEASDFHAELQEKKMELKHVMRGFIVDSFENAVIARINPLTHEVIEIM